MRPIIVEGRLSSRNSFIDCSIYPAGTPTIIGGILVPVAPAAPWQPKQAEPILRPVNASSAVAGTASKLHSAKVARLWNFMM
jgi:hypothetical protein